MCVTLSFHHILLARHLHLASATLASVAIIEAAWATHHHTQDQATVTRVPLPLPRPRQCWQDDHPQKLQNQPQSEIEAISPTLGFAIQTFQYEGYHINVWDIGGQKSLRAYWKNYFEKTDAIIWVVDSSDTARLSDCKEELDKLLQEERLHGATILIFANKQDLPGALSAEQIKRQLDLDRVSTHSWRIQPCSAYTGDHLVQGLDWTVKDVAKPYLLPW